MPHPSGVRMTGPLAPYQDALWAHLLALGYAHFSAKNLTGVASHLSRWLAEKALNPSDLTEERLREFLDHRRDIGRTCWRSMRAIEPILSCLRAQGVIPPASSAPADTSPLGRLLEGYSSHLCRERGVLPRTAKRYLGVVRRFVDRVPGRTPDVSMLEGITASHLSSFILAEARTRSVGSAKISVTALRSFLRYLNYRGVVRDLASAVPAIAGRRLTGLPKGIAAEDVQRLLDGCDREGAIGRRDYAILLLLSRLGLRGHEVVLLDLDDVAWTRGELRVRGKGAEGRLPLPHDVGEALAYYLEHARPRSTSPRLFLQARAPYGPFGRGSIGGVVSRAGQRVGLRVKSHQLRHTTATRMLRNGASLPEVAHVLRHRSLSTTVIYAKVDRLSLRELARSWPGGAA